MKSQFDFCWIATNCQLYLENTYKCIKARLFCSLTLPEPCLFSKEFGKKINSFWNVSMYYFWKFDQTNSIFVWDVFLVQRDQKTRVKLLFWSRSDRCNKLQFSQGHEIAFVQLAYKSYLFHIMLTLVLKHSWDEKKLQVWN